LNGISLFANVGIAETYVHDHGINIVVANELLKKRAEFHKDMYPHCSTICGDITDDKIYKKLLTKAKKMNCEFFAKV
jgi:DNA (cytosine-5)-methyltransferase 1